MIQATIGQIDARLTEIDDVLFKVSTGQAIMSDAEIIAMQAEAGRIMTTLAAALGKPKMSIRSSSMNARTKFGN